MNNNYNQNQNYNNQNYNVNYNNNMNQNNNVNYNNMNPNLASNYNNQMIYNNPYYKPKTPFEFPKDKWSIMGLVGALLMLIGSMLDFVTFKASYAGEEVANETVNYLITNGEIKDGILMIGFSIAIAALIIFRKKIIAIVPALIGGGILLMDFLDLQERIEMLERTLSFAELDISYGPALFVIPIGIILVGIYAVITQMESSKNKTPVYNQQTYNNLNNQQTYNNMNGMYQSQPMNQQQYQNNQNPNIMM